MLAERTLEIVGYPRGELSQLRAFITFHWRNVTSTLEICRNPRWELSQLRAFITFHWRNVTSEDLLCRVQNSEEGIPGAKTR